jgi:hypothetical protein
MVLAVERHHRYWFARPFEGARRAHMPLLAEKIPRAKAMSSDQLSQAQAVQLVDTAPTDRLRVEAT